MEQPDMTQEETLQPASTPKKKPVLIQFLAGILIVVLLAIVGIVVYTKSQIQHLSDSPFVVSAASILHVPIAKVNGHAIAYSDFMMDFKSLKNFYAVQGEELPEAGEADIAEQVISRLIINEFVGQFAKQYNVTVEESDIVVAKAELLSQFPDEAAAEQEIQSTFGWSLDTFTDRVIVPIVREQKVDEAFSTDTGVDAAYQSEQVQARHILFTYEDESEKERVRATAQGVLDRIKNGEDFATLATEFGEDGTAEVGGDLGWVDRGVTVPSFEDAIFALEKGQLSEELVETEFGFHIVRVEDVRTINDFAMFFQAKLAQADIDIYADIANPFLAPSQEEGALPTE